MAKIQPSVLSIQFVVGQGLTKFIDLSQSASVVNRRFYRQGLNWAVAGFTLATGPGQTGNVSISKIPNTWIASNAWHKSYATWKKQQDKAIADSGSQSAVAKYRDFKIHANVLHVDTTFNSNLEPVDADGVNFLSGEWQASQIVIPQLDPDATGTLIEPREFLLHMVGVNNHGGLSRGIISGYAHSRAFPQSPDPVSPNVDTADNWMRAMFDVGSDTSEIVDNATDRNDDLPYNQTEYPGGEINAKTLEIVHESALIASVNSTTRNLSGTNVPCGLLQIINGVDGPLDLFVHLVPGPARGYLTQPMQDM